MRIFENYIMESLVCSFSGVYEDQGFSVPGAVCIDFRDLAGTSCYCTAEEEIERRICCLQDGIMSGKACGRKSRKSSKAGELPRLRWIDSGDYHYMTYILAKREREPFSLLLLDNHPDNQEPEFGDVLSCGSWVNRLPDSCREVLTIGPETKDYPSGWAKGKRVYISLDKDIMSKEYARTDWSQGEYSLKQIEGIIKQVAEEGTITAIDICGELSMAKGATPEDLTINRITNTRLLELISEL